MTYSKAPRVGRSQSGIALINVLIAAALLGIVGLIAIGGLGRLVQSAQSFSRKNQVVEIEASLVADLYDRLAALTNELGGGLCTMTNHTELANKLNEALGSDRYKARFYSEKMAPIGRIPFKVIERCSKSTLHKIGQMQKGSGGEELPMYELCDEMGFYGCFVISDQNAEDGSLMKASDMVVEIRFHLMDLNSGESVPFAAYNDSSTPNRQGVMYYSMHWAMKSPPKSGEGQIVKSGVIRGSAK